MAEWYKAVYGQDDNYSDYCRVIRNVANLRMHEPYLV
jgi:hypothetical protein